MNSTNLYSQITSQITELMQQHGSDWTRPWTSTAGGPSNALTGDNYKGINTLLLNLEANYKGYSRPCWATFKQWRMKGGKVRKGQKGTLCVFYKPVAINQPDEASKTVPVMKHFFLFNADQVEGIEYPETEEPVAVEGRNHIVDELLNGTGESFMKLAPEPSTALQKIISTFHHYLRLQPLKCSTVRSYMSCPIGRVILPDLTVKKACKVDLEVVLMQWKN